MEHNQGMTTDPLYDRARAAYEASRWIAVANACSGLAVTDPDINLDRAEANEVFVFALFGQVGKATNAVQAMTNDQLVISENAAEVMCRIVATEARRRIIKITEPLKVEPQP
jgi:hypothetical protein